MNSSASKLVVGEIEHIFLKDKFFENNYSLNLEKRESTSVSGLNNFYRPQYFRSLPYVRLKDIPQKFL